jgi:aspartyl-tRNA(Asn)/glutamyl-tRNA(Gln) amidotransferase subunit A
VNQLFPFPFPLLCYAYSMKSAHQITTDLKQGLYSVEKLTSEALSNAEAIQKNLNAFISISSPAIERARELDQRLAKGEEIGPLGGVPIVVKDNICTKGLRTTAGSKSLEHFIPPYNATVVERLEQAGAVIIAKANLDEFGMGGSNENSAFGPVKNPWNPDFVAGGSSGGSAVAVAAGVAPIALGTDTGGSVRLPAAFNGMIGFKPTYGRLSRYGVIAFASSLDQVGVVTQNPKDLALVMDVMAGHDPHDSTSISDDQPKFIEALNMPDLKGLRIGLIKELCHEGNSQGVLAALDKTKGLLESLGATIKEVSLPNVLYGIATYYLVAPAEASSNLARYDAMVYSSRLGENRQGQADVMMKSRGATLGPEVRRRILMGTYALSSGYYDAYYGKALKVRRLIADDFAKAFAEVDILMTPTGPSTAYRFGEKSDPLAMYLVDMDTVMANLVGLPAISVPAGKAEDNMPCGVQFLAPALQDETLVGVCGVLEQALGNSFAPLATQNSVKFV